MLRFYAVWDDRQMLSGDRRPYVVHYYLEDDTMEVLETLHDHNSGRDQFPKFLRRARLLKVGTPGGSTSLPSLIMRHCCRWASVAHGIGCLPLDQHGVLVQRMLRPSRMQFLSWSLQ